MDLLKFIVFVVSSALLAISLLVFGVDLALLFSSIGSGDFFVTFHAMMSDLELVVIAGVGLVVSRKWTKP